MKKNSLAVLFLIIILVSPSLLFAEDWVKDIVGTVKGTAGGVVGFATGNSDLGNRVTNANWGQTITANPGGVIKTMVGTAGGLLNHQIGNTIATTNWSSTIGGPVNKMVSMPLDFKIPSNNWSTPAANPVDYSGWGKGTAPYDAGKQATGIVTNVSNYKTRPGKIVNP